MKKMLTILFVFSLIISLFACKKTEVEDFTTSNVEMYQKEKEIFSYIKHFDIDNTNGYDYSLEQKYNDNVVNSHLISVRIDRSRYVGSRIENKKTINSDIYGEQYINESATAYYKNNMIGTFKNNEWSWTLCTLFDFSSVNIEYFDIDISNVYDLQLSSNEDYSTLTFKVKDSDASLLLGVSDNIKNLSFIIIVDTSKEQLINFNMSYSQNLTTTQFSFAPYYGVVEIEMPE